ncbi:MAG: TIM barrel protein [Bacillota bacterium]
MQFGLTSTTFRQIRNLDKIIAIAKKAGCTTIEWGGDIHVKSVETAKLVAEKCNGVLDINSYGGYYVVGSCKKEEWLKNCQIASAMGARTIRVWLGKTGSAKTTAEQFEKMVADAREMCAVAREYGVIIAPECHGGTYNDKTDAFLKFVEALGEDNFKTYFQSIYRDLPYDLDRLERTIEYIDTIHISFSEQWRMQLFGRKDKKHIAKLLKKIKSLHFDGTILLEYTYLGVPAFCVKCCENLKSTWEKI